MSGHTPGPWAASLDQRHEKWLITAADGEIEICQDRGWGDEYESEDYANARLIAAAPELLEALIDARKQLEAYEEALNGEDYNSPRINEAIAKATGAQS